MPESPEGFEIVEDSPANAHAVAEGAEAVETKDVGSKSGLQDMLLSTGPETPLSQVDSPWNPAEGGMTRVYRGFQKMADFDGMPALGDILIGFAEWWQSLEVGDVDESAGDVDGSDEPAVPDATEAIRQ